MLLWLILLPVMASALIGLCKFPGRATAIVSASLSMLLTLLALFGLDCSSCCEASSTHLSLELPLSRIMILLTALVTLAACIGMRAPDRDADRSWAISTLLISCGATGAFLSDNILACYAFHELALIPTFVMIGFYGRGNRRMTAWMATLYLGLASMVLLAGILLLGNEMKTWTFTGIAAAVQAGALPDSGALIGGLLLLGFGTLVSLFPFHSWAGPAYAAAPTPVAMMHAGVLKKFGLYGLFTLAYVFGPQCEILFGDWMGLLLVLLLGNVLWVGFVTINKMRLDDMLGNSSVMHMGFLFLAFAAFSLSGATNVLAFEGGALLMVAHGLSIAMLFLLCGQIESQTGTLELDAMGGLGSKLPRLGFLFGLAGMASIGLPLLANFPGELSIFLSCFADSPLNSCEPGTACWLSQLFGEVGPLQICCFFALWGLVIGAVYMLRAIRAIFGGEVAHGSTRATALSCRDLLSASFLAGLLLLFGIVPALLLALMR